MLCWGVHPTMQNHPAMYHILYRIPNNVALVRDIGQTMEISRYIGLAGVTKRKQNFPELVSTVGMFAVNI